MIYIFYFIDNGFRKKNREKSSNPRWDYSFLPIIAKMGQVATKKETKGKVSISWDF